jgi:hypothetical protein
LLLTHTIKTLRDNGVNVYFHCHATVDSDIKQLIDSLGESNFFYELNTRGGNLNEDTLKIFCNKGEIYCTTAGLGFNHNVLLPDGRVLLCCMDYSMRHILGNLLESDYISLHTSHETQKLLEGVKNENSMIICRSCSRARQEDILW